MRSCKIVKFEEHKTKASKDPVTIERKSAEESEPDEITKKRIEREYGYRIPSEEELEKAVKGGHMEYTGSNVIDGVDETFNRDEYDKANETVKENRKIAREIAKNLNL